MMFRKFIEKVDRTLHNKTDFFKNRRKADPVAKQLAYSLENVNLIQDFASHIFPPNLIFFDNSLKKEQMQIFIKNFKAMNKNETLFKLKIVY